jgi:hypothetical protein
MMGRVASLCHTKNNVARVGCLMVSQPRALDRLLDDILMPLFMPLNNVKKVSLPVNNLLMLLVGQ